MNLNKQFNPYRKPLDFEIEDCDGNVVEFRIGAMKASDGVDVAMILGKVLGPFVLAVAGGKTTEEILKDPNAVVSIVNVIQSLHNHKKDFDKIVDKFCSLTHVKIQNSDNQFNWVKMTGVGHAGANSFEELFEGRYDVLVKWFGKVLEHNFKSFFGSMKSVKASEDLAQ